MDLTEGFDAQAILEAILPAISTWGLKVLGALALLLVGRVVAAAARNRLGRVLDRTKLDRTLIPFVTGLLYYVILIFLVVVALGIFGIPTASIIAVLGAAGLAVGLALQGTLSNFAAGVMLLIFRPFRVGDYVDAGGTAGSVVSIGVFTTTLNTPDNVRIIVPNSSIYGQEIRNYSENATGPRDRADRQPSS